MELFGQNYLRIRNESILPSIKYGIKKNKVEHWDFKDILTTQLVELRKISNNSYEIEMSQSYFYKALHCDIELFLNKCFVQYNEFIVSKKNSSTWSFVTMYYLSFFSMTLLFRLMRKGFIFLQNEQAKNLEDFSLAMYGVVISVKPGNYYFNYKAESVTGNVILNFSSKGEGVHKLSWIQLENTFRDFIPFSDSDEKTIFQSLLNFFLNFNSEFPSQLRNKLNYHGISSILDLDKKMINLDLKLDERDLIRGILSINNDVKIENQINAISFLSSFLFRYAYKLYGDYNFRSQFGNDFEKIRKDFFKLKGISIFN